MLTCNINNGYILGRCYGCASFEYELFTTFSFCATIDSDPPRRWASARHVSVLVKWKIIICKTLCLWTMKIIVGHVLEVCFKANYLQKWLFHRPVNSLALTHPSNNAFTYPHHATTCVRNFRDSKKEVDTCTVLLWSRSLFVLYGPYLKIPCPPLVQYSKSQCFEPVKDKYTALVYNLIRMKH